MSEKNGEQRFISPEEETDEVINQRWERTRPIADKLADLIGNESESAEGYDEVIKYLKDEPKGAFPLIYHVMEKWPKPADPESRFNSAPVMSIADLIQKMAEKLREGEEHIENN